MLVNPNVLAEKFRSEIKAIIEAKKLHPRLVGVLASRESSSHTYSQFMRVGCEKVGVEYTEVIIDEHDNLEQTILKINKVGINCSSALRPLNKLFNKFVIL